VRYKKLVRNALFAAFPVVTDRGDRRRLLGFTCPDAQYELERQIRAA
jgi:hypothetical protein